jgi:integral membrane sensor domain MASE1
MITRFRKHSSAATITVIVLGWSLGIVTASYPHSPLLWWTKIVIGSILIVGLAVLIYALWPALRKGARDKATKTRPIFEDETRVRRLDQ